MIKHAALSILICIALNGITLTQTQAQPTLPGGLPMPSLDDERNTYLSWGWTWTADKEPGAVTEPIANFNVSDPDIHGDTEGDDLWTYLMMYRRTGNQVYLNRAQAWARYFKQDYRSCIGSQNYTFCYDRDSFMLDHLYGWGLIALYEYIGDSASLLEAENIATEVEVFWNSQKAVPGSYEMANYGLRQGARHLLFVTRVAEVTKKERWITLRDKLIDLWIQSPDWDARGMYFRGEWSTDAELGSGSYAKGDRIQGSFHIGILMEAFFQAFRTTGRTALRDKMLAIANYVDHYGLSISSQTTGRIFGIVNNSVWHNYDGGTFCAPEYTISLVNSLVLGYKYSGNRNFYDRAKYFFNRGTKGVYGSCTQRSVPDTQVHHFVDTRFSSGTGFYYLDFNKGELQYTYLLFEKSGNPDVIANGDITSPVSPKNLRIIN